jgi:hypothetical protein
MATLLQGDGHAWPAFAGGLERHGQVLDTRYMLDNALGGSGSGGGGAGGLGGNLDTNSRLQR